MPSNCPCFTLATVLCTTLIVLWAELKMLHMFLLFLPRITLLLLLYCIVTWTNFSNEASQFPICVQYYNTLIRYNYAHSMKFIWILLKSSLSSKYFPHVNKQSYIYISHTYQMSCRNGPDSYYPVPAGYWIVLDTQYSMHCSQSVKKK